MRMTDPADALRYLQLALDVNEVTLRPCALHPEVAVLLDHPNGITRFTYAQIKGKTVQAIALFAEAERMLGLPCFGAGVAVLESLRGKGIARSLVEKAIDELRHGFSRTPMKTFYLEAVVLTTNEPSNRLASRVFSSTRETGIDAFCGEPIYQYVRKVECEA